MHTITNKRSYRLILESVDKFCYLGDMLSVYGDADPYAENRIQIGWNIFRHLVPLLTNKDISLKVRGSLYSSCVRRCMLHGSEENEVMIIILYNLVV